MDDTVAILSNMVNFLTVGVICIIALAIIFEFGLKNYNVKTSKIKFYGLFLGMGNREILAFSLITLNYVFLVWCTTLFSGINAYYVFVTVLFIVLADIIVKDYDRITIDLVYSMINISCIFVTSLLHNYLMNRYQSVLLLVVLGLVMLVSFLYYTYMTFKLLNNVVLKEENLKKRDYKKL